MADGPEPARESGPGPSPEEPPLDHVRYPVPGGVDGTESAAADLWIDEDDAGDPNRAPDPEAHGPDADPNTGNPDTDTPESGDSVAAPAQSELMANGAIMAVGTIISRVTGVARDMAMTAALGLGVVADIFTVGNTIPNTVYVMTVGGAMNAVFVPQMVRRIHGDSDKGAGFIDRLLTLTMVVLAILTGISLLIAPLLTRIYASPDYSPEQMSLAVAFARYCLPQVFFYGLFTLLSQVINARGRFGPPMFAPIANNVVSIAVFLGFLAVAGPTAASGGTLNPAQTAWLGLGSTVAVAIQALLLVPFLYSADYRFRPRFDWRGWGLGRTGTLAFWTIGLLAANQVSFIVHSRLATTANVLAQEQGLPEAGITTYNKAYLIFFLPHSIVTVSLVTALLPGLARVASAGHFDVMRRTLGETTRTVAALVVPITAVLIATAPLLASLMFGYGASGQDAADQIGFTTIGMLVGLLPFSIYFILLRGWYSLEDTRTPFYLSLVLNAINVALSYLFFWALPVQQKVPGIGLAFGLTYWAMMLVAWPVLSRRLGGLATPEIWLSIAKVLMAGAVASLASFLALAYFNNALPEMYDSPLQKLVVLAVVSLVGLVVYLVGARVLGITEVTTVLRILRAKLGR